METFDNFSDWLANVRLYILGKNPDLASLFDKYANEAKFGRRWLAPDIAKLAKGAAILEVGAGFLLLSCQLAREGFIVTALEPIGEGFSQFENVRSLVMEYARQDGINYRLLECPVEELDIDDRFDLAFSVNVMEHVASVQEALTRVTRSLRQSGIYRFTCPNYQFPYEPHFSLPTFFSKSLTEKLLWRAIVNSPRLDEPEAVWKSLNWIGVGQVSRICGTLPHTRVKFYTTMISDTLTRAIIDHEFAKRHSDLVVKTARLFVSTGIHRQFARLPASFQPIIDCEVSVTHHSSKD